MSAAASVAVAGLAAAGTVLAAGGGGAGASGHRASGHTHVAHQKAGGTLTVLENKAYIGDWPEGLDPATNLDALANSSIMDAVFGELFQVGPHNTTVDDLASGAKLTNGNKTLTIHLRPHVRFTDGTPFDAAAVVANFRRDLKSSSPAKPPWPPVRSMKAVGPTTVVVTFSSPDGAAVDQFQSANVNWIASLGSLKRLGAKRFALDPVGAGPFVVKTDVLSSKLVLKRNPHYWQAGRPYLKGLTFLTVASDESALEDLRSGVGQAYEFMDTPQLVSGFRSAGYTVTTDPGTVPLDVQINTLVAPFTNKKARLALYDATNASAIDHKVLNGTCPVTQSFTGPGGLFYEPKVPGYPSYNLGKAKKLVRQLGGLSFTLDYSPGLGLGTSEAEALQTMYQAAGMKVTLRSHADLASVIQQYNTHTWQTFLAAIGSWDPASGIGVAFRLASNGPFTGVKSPQVDKYINAGLAASNPAARARAYHNLAVVLARQAVTPFICAGSSWDVAKKGVRGPGLTSVTAGFGDGALTLWQDVSMASK